jgi:transposase
VGFSPSQPINASWLLPGQRKFIPYEAPRGRRLNTMAALFLDSPTPSLWWGSVPHSLTSEHLLVFVRALARLGTPLVVVLDNASIHISRVVSRVVQEARPALAAEGITLYYLPPYSPKLNAIEPYFGAIKYHDLPDRTYPTMTDLEAAVAAAFERTEARLRKRSPLKSRHHLRPAA